MDEEAVKARVRQLLIQGWEHSDRTNEISDYLYRAAYADGLEAAAKEAEQLPVESLEKKRVTLSLAETFRQQALEARFTKKEARDE